MKICRYRSRGEGPFWGRADERYVERLEARTDRPEAFRRTGEFHDWSEVELLPPVTPGKIIGVAGNFEVRGEDKPRPTFLFLKAPESVILGGNAVALPPGRAVWGEPEIGIVIRKAGYRIDPGSAADYVLGYVAVNDITAESPPGQDHHLLESKSRIGFCPMGKFIETEFEFAGRTITAHVNGKLHREGRTEKMRWNLARAIAEASSVLPLQPFDLILTGCPPRVGERVFLKSGDEFTVAVDGLAPVTTRFVEAPA